MVATSTLRSQEWLPSWLRQCILVPIPIYQDDHLKNSQCFVGTRDCGALSSESRKLYWARSCYHWIHGDYYRLSWQVHRSFAPASVIGHGLPTSAIPLEACHVASARCSNRCMIFYRFASSKLSKAVAGHTLVLNGLAAYLAGDIVTCFRVLHASQDTGCRLRFEIRDSVPMVVASGFLTRKTLWC